MAPQFSGFSILNAFRPYLCLLNACNHRNRTRDNNNWRCTLRSIFETACLALIILLLFVMIILCFWYLLEINIGLKEAVVSTPILLTFVQMEIAFIAMVINNWTISKTIDEVQKVVNESKFLITSAHKKGLAYANCWYALQLAQY